MVYPCLSTGEGKITANPGQPSHVDQVSCWPILENHTGEETPIFFILFQRLDLQGW